MDTLRFTGKKTVYNYVSYSGAGILGDEILVVSADSRPEIHLSAEEVLFNPIKQGQTPSQTLDVEFTSDFRWQISRVETPPAAPFTASVKETFRRPGQAGYQLKATIKPNAAVGRFREKVFLITNSPDAPRLEVLVEGFVQPANQPRRK